MWEKLSNSRDFLKLMVPNCDREATSGQDNYLCTVTSQKMIKSEMEYRGSKSDFKVMPLSLKEQRVNDSCCGIISTQLKYTLTGFERNCPVKNLTNQIRLPLFREYSSISSQSSIKNPALDVSSCALHP